MKYTNNKELPNAIADTIKNSAYCPTYKSYGATTLLKDPLEVVLLRRYWEDLEQDVADSLFAFLGTAIHDYIKQHDTTEYSEYKMSVPVSKSNVVGVCDLYDKTTNTMVDYKTTTVWKVLHKDYKDWEKQLLIYVWLLEQQEHIKCRKARIVALLRDWSLSELMRSGGEYPKKQVETIDFEFSDEDVENIGKFINDKIIEFERLKYTSDEYIPECSEEAKWTSPTRYAVYKIGNKTAKRIVDTKEQAEEYITWFLGENPKVKREDLEIVERKGEDKKCQSYCQVSKYCPFYQAKLNKVEENETI